MKVFPHGSLLSGTRSILLKLRNRRVKTIPWLCAPNPNVRLRPKPLRVIQAGCLYPCVFWPRRTRRKQRGSAEPAKRSGRDIAAFGSLLEVLCLSPSHADGTCRHDEGWGVRATAGNLTVAAMAVEHTEWRCSTFVSDGSASTSSAEWNFHGARLRCLTARLSGARLRPSAAADGWVSASATFSRPPAREQCVPPQDSAVGFGPLPGSPIPRARGNQAAAGRFAESSWPSS